MSIEELKTLQLKIIEKNRKCNAIGIPIILIVITFTIIFKLMNATPMPFLIMIPFFELIIYLMIITIIKGCINEKDIKIFYKEFKKIFVLKSLNNFFDNITYTPENGFDEDYVDSIGMIDTGDIFASNDYVKGLYKNITFEQSDIHIQEKHEEEDKDGKKKTVWETTFMGRLMTFDFNKTFKTNMLVSNSCRASKLPWNKKFSKIQLEDVEFNKMFNVYAESDHEAFYILTPHFMEKLMNMAKKLKCEIMFCFVNNKLHIAINNYEDSFEYNVFKVINEKEIEENILKDLNLIIDIVEDLSLDNNLFRKEV